jgi:hypothetical protein
MNDQRRASGFGSDRGGKLGVFMRGGDSGESRQVLSGRDEFSKDEQHILDVLERGLSREFPNPGRIGCPGSEVLRGLASHNLRLADAHKWLDHLSACSPCYQEFTELRKEAASRRRRLQVWLAAAAVVIFAVAGWLWVRTHQPVQGSETAVLDLRGLSVSRGENPGSAPQPPLELHQSAKQLILDLPVGSEEGTYDVALLSETGTRILSATGKAQLQDRVVVLHADVDLGDIRPGLYLLAIRKPGLEWTRFLVHVS